MEFTFEKATRLDIPSIIEIAESHYYTLGPQGFLVSRYDYNTVSSKMFNPNSDVYVTKDESGRVIAWIILTRIYHNLLMNNLQFDDFTFRNEEDKVLLKDENHWHMEQGAVRKEMLHSGVGTFYYNEMMKMFPDHSFSSNVITKPVENRASVRIKDSFDFRVAATFKAPTYKNLPGYESTLFIRDKK